MSEGQPKFRLHAFVCGHERDANAQRPSCFPHQSLELMKVLKRRVIEAGVVDVRVQKSGCLDQCEKGPTCVVYPDGVWYTLSDESVLEAVFQHLVSGTVSQSATMRDD